MRGARREGSHLVRVEEAGAGLGAVFDAGSSESQQGLRKVLIKLKLPTAGCVVLQGESTGLTGCLASWLSAATALLVFHLFLYLKWIVS